MRELNPRLLDENQMATAVSRMDQKNLKNICNGFILLESNQLSFREREMKYPIFEVTITICIKILEPAVGIEPTIPRLLISYISLSNMPTCSANFY